MLIQRRHMLKVASAAVGLATLGSTLPAYGKAPMAESQVIRIHRFKLGDFEVSTILDGYVELDPRLLNAQQGKMQSLMEAATLPFGPIRTPVNTFLVNTGDKLVLLDTSGTRFLGPNAGRLAQGLAAAGVTPAQIDEIYITHMHGDYLHGAVTPEGAALFPNAVLRVAQQDVDYWLNPDIEAAAPAAQKGRFIPAKRAKAAYGERLKPFKQGSELTPGIVSVAAVGHSPGHLCFMVASGGAKMLTIGDLIHIAPVQFASTEITISFDLEQPKAGSARINLFDLAAKENILIAAVHLPFPGLGTLRKEGTSYAYTPMTWRLF